MKFKPKNIVIIIVLIVIFFISLTFHLPKQGSESFKDGECSSSVQTELQSKIISKIHQPIINEKNKVVNADSVVYNIREKNQNVIGNIFRVAKIHFDLFGIRL